MNRWTVERYGVQRVAGLPEDALALVRTPRAAAAVDESAERELSATASAAALADALHAVVPTAEPAVRRDLLALRRSAFAGRLRPLGAAATDVLAQLHPQVLRLLDVARRDEEALRRARAAAEAALVADPDAVRAALRAAAADEEFRRSLCVASPLAVRALQREARGGPTSRKDAARLDRTLLEYLCRAAVKTSPFSGLTTVAPVRFVGQPSAVPVAAGADAPTPLRRVQLSATFLQRLADQVAAHDSTFLDLPLRLSPTVRRDEDFVRTVQRRRSSETGKGAGEVGLESDRLLLLRDTAVLREVLAVVQGAGWAGRPVRHLLSELAGRVGEGESDRLQALRALVRVGVAECELLRVPVHAPDPARAVAGALRGLGVDWATGLADRLDALAVLADRYAGEGAQDRPATEDEVRSGARAALEAVGGTPDRVPSTVLYEDVLAAAGPVGEGGVAEVVLGAAARADLAVVADLVRALDPVEPHRQHLAGFFVSRFGVGAEHGDVEVLFEDFAEDLYDEYVRWVPQVERFAPDGAYVPHANWLGLPAVAALDEARRGVRDLVAARTAQWVAAGRPERGVVLSPQDLQAVLAALPPDTRAAATANAFVQRTGLHDGPGWVLNKVYGGPGFGWSRFAGLLGHDEVLLKEFCDQLRPADGTGTLPVEVLGGEARSTLNVHPLLVPHVLRTPGDPALPEGVDVLTVDDLLVRHDPRTGVLELRSRRLDRPVLPVYFGYLVPQALSDTARALLLFAPSSAPVLDLFEGVPVEPDEFGTVRRPRLAVGDVVVSRASWTVPPREEAQDWAAARSWAHSIGLPSEGFATTSPDGRPRTAKPRYHHLDAPPTWTALDSGTAPGDHLTFFERLPGAPAPGTRTRELVVELTRQETP